MSVRPSFSAGSPPSTGGSHEVDFFNAMEEVAMQVAEEGDNLPPVKYDALGRTAILEGKKQRADFPQEGEPAPPKQKSALSAQADSFRLAHVYKAKGSIILDDADLPPSERKGKPSVVFVRESQAERPGDEHYIIYPDPQTKKEREAERRLVREVHDIRELRKAQATRRRMTGNAGRYAFWRTQLRHASERLSDSRELGKGKISSQDAHQRAKARKTDVTTVMHRRIARTSRKLDTRTEKLVNRMSKATREARKKTKT